MNIGKMRFTVMLEKPTTIAANELGEIPHASPGSNFTAVAKVWAAIRPLSSNEIVRARAVQLDTTHMITIRYYKGLTSQWRVSQKIPGVGCTIFNIRGVTDPDMQRSQLNLECVVTTDG